MKKPPPGYNAQKRPDFKGFHGFTGLCGKAVKALSLYAVGIVRMTSPENFPPLETNRRKIKMWSNN